jgi:type VI secretion system protein
LQCLLNTRHGNVPIADDYGIPDFTNLMSGFLESKRSIEQTIRNTIVKYEPRLQGVRVSFLEQEDDKLTLRFQISAQLALGVYGDPVIFESVLDSGGRFTVKN